MCHMSCVRCHMSLFILSQTVIARDLQFSHNIYYSLCVQCHMSGVTNQVSHVRCHMSLCMCLVPCVMCYVSFIIYIFLQGGWVSWLRLCYQKGLPRLVFRLFLFYFFITNALIPNIYSSWLVVVRFGSLKKQIYENLFKRHWNILEVPKMVNFRTCGRDPLCTFSKVRR